MRGYNRFLRAVAVVGLTATMAACASGINTSSTSTAGKKPVGAFKTLTGKTTAVVLDPGFLAALKSLNLTPTPYGTAQIKPVGKNVEAIFPITGGHVTVYSKGEVNPYVQGEVDHAGSGLTLTSGKTSVTISNFVIHPGRDSSLTGDVSIDHGTPLHAVNLFALDGSTLQTPTISSAGVATLEGTTIYLSSVAAQALNGVFHTSALAGHHKVKIGYAIITATGT